MALPGFTPQEELDFYYLIRNAEWRILLDQAENEVIARIETLLDELRQELTGRIARYADGSHTKTRLERLLAEINTYTAIVQGDLVNIISEAAGIAGAFSPEEQCDILSVGGKAHNFRPVTLGIADFGALFLNTPLAGYSLQQWVKRALGEGEQRVLDAVRKGMFLQEPYSPIIQRVLREAENITLREATTLVRTYVQSASVSAQYAVYEANSDIIGWVEWTSVLEGGYSKTGRGVCPICAALDGMRYRLNETKPPCPRHPRCRCLWKPVTDWKRIGIPELDLDNAVRPYTIRPNKNIDAGGTRAILEGGQHTGSWGAWAEDRSARFKINAIGPRRYALWKESGLDFATFMHSMVDRRSGELLSLQQLRARLESQGTASFIRFRPAESLREAYFQARELGVKANYNSGELGVARLVNDAMAHIKTRGFPLPAIVQYDSAFFKNEPDALAAYVASRDALYIKPGLTRPQIVSESKIQYADNFWSTSSEGHMFLHEIGHGVHFKNSSALYKLSSERRFSNAVTRIIEREVSGYAACSPQEFVAEVFAGLIHGKGFNRRIMQLYSAYGGSWK